jgi:hypothetical protein
MMPTQFSGIEPKVEQPRTCARFFYDIRFFMRSTISKTAGQ